MLLISVKFRRSDFGRRSVLRYGKWPQERAAWGRPPAGDTPPNAPLPRRSVCPNTLYPIPSRPFSPAPLHAWATPGDHGTSPLKADVVVIGAGLAGITAAVLAASLKRCVILVERDRTDGECLFNDRPVGEAANLLRCLCL